jgi:hypothetical protein
MNTGAITVVSLGIAEKTLRRPSYPLHRAGAEIGRGIAQAEEVILYPGGAWSLSAENLVVAKSLSIGIADAIIGRADIDLAPGIQEKPMFKRSDFPGMGADPALIPKGAPAWIKTVQAGAAWDTAHLFADATAFPPPDEPNQPVPLDRVLAGTVTYDPNSGFAVLFAFNQTWWGVDTFIRLYFGGAAPVKPSGTSGGQFCLSIRGSGLAFLYERDDVNQAWIKRRTLQWTDNVAHGQFTRHLLWVIPYARDRILIGASNTEVRKSVFDLDPSNFSTKYSWDLYRETKTAAGHLHTKTMTGPGIVRVDVRRDSRQPFSLARAKYPESGVLRDGPFVVDSELPAGTPIRIRLDSYILPNGGGLVAAIYDATTDAILATDSDGNFLSNEGQNAYYVKITFTSSEDHFFSPILWGYHVNIAPEYQEWAFTPISGGNIKELSITGDDFSGPDHGTAELTITDPADELLILRVRDRIRSYISLVDPSSGALISHLFEGETVQVPGQLRGIPGATYPSADWHDYQCRLVGLWSRMAERFSRTGYNFAVDLKVPEDPDTGERLPWKVIDIIKALLNEGGFPDDEILFPDLPLRFWPTAEQTSNAYAIYPGGAYAHVAQELAWTYLGCALVRDPNAGARGAWRLIPKPRAPYTNFLATFHLEVPAPTGPTFICDREAWPDGETYITHYGGYEEAPEVNTVSVVGVRDAKDGEGMYKLVRNMINQDSISNPGSADFLGREVPHLRIDPALHTQEQVDWVARRVYDDAAHKRKHAEFVAPLLLVTDPLDPHQVRPRALRVFDLCYVGGQPFLLTSVDLHWETDFVQFATHEGYYLT